MICAAAVERDKLGKMFDTERLSGRTFTMTLSPASESDETEFKTLKGIAGKRLDIDEVRKERLRL